MFCSLWQCADMHASLHVICSLGRVYVLLSIVGLVARPGSVDDSGQQQALDIGGHWMCLGCRLLFKLAFS